MPEVKAVVLLSGGLDSTIAAKIIQDMKIELYGLNFMTPFCQCNRGEGCKHTAYEVSQILGIKLKTIFLADEYFEIIKSPKYGYGKNLNPCIDCRILMHKMAKEYMKEIDAKFIVTGEVLGQRPKSQFLSALKIIERESGIEGYVVRPLSAKILPPTIPEKKGWVNREKLLDIHGRSRKIQLKLANMYKLKGYSCPAGGCLLTMKEFAKKVKDLIEHSQLNLFNVNLLKLGRHFRLNENTKIIVGRNESENIQLSNIFNNGMVLLEPHQLKGPSGIICGKNIGADEIKLGARIIAYYCKSAVDNYKINYRFNKKSGSVEVKKILEIEKYKI